MKYVKRYKIFINENINELIIKPLNEYETLDSRWWQETVQTLITTYYPNDDDILNNVLYLLSVYKNESKLKPPLEIYYDESESNDDISPSNYRILRADYEFDTKQFTCEVSINKVSYTREYGYDVRDRKDGIILDDIITFSDLLSALEQGFIKMFELE